MQVFNAFWKIVKSNIGTAIMYLVIFLVIVVMISNAAPNNKTFVTESVPFAIINNDTDSDIVQGLYKVLEKDNKLVDLNDNEDELKDALFFRDVYYIVRIPKGFTEDFRSGKEVKLDKYTVPDSSMGVYLDMIVNKYLNSVNLYKNYTDLNEAEYINSIIANLSNETNIKITENNTKSTDKMLMDFYFEYASYAALAIILFSVSTFIMKFNRKDLKRRTECSPLSKRQINKQILFGVIGCTLAVYLVFLIVGVILYQGDMFTIKGAIHSINFLVYMIFSASLALLLGNAISNEFVLNGIVNSMTLIFSFLGGVFVPQEVLSSTVNFAGSFTPTYWYIKASNALITIPNYNIENIMKVFINTGVVILFAIAILIINLVITKQRKTQS